MLRESMSNDIVREKLGKIPKQMKDLMIRNLEIVLGDSKRYDIDIETAGVFLSSYLLRSEIMRMMMGSDPFHKVDDARLWEIVAIFLHGYLREGS
jgi:hypothetical protein